MALNFLNAEDSLSSSLKNDMSLRLQYILHKIKHLMASIIALFSVINRLFKPLDSMFSSRLYWQLESGNFSNIFAHKVRQVKPVKAAPLKLVEKWLNFAFKCLAGHIA